MAASSSLTKYLLSVVLMLLGMGFFYVGYNIANGVVKLKEGLDEVLAVVKKYKGGVVITPTAAKSESK